MEKALEIRWLKEKLREYKGNKTIQALLLQTYIKEYGPIPDEYGDTIRQILSEE